MYVSKNGYVATSRGWDKSQFEADPGSVDIKRVHCLNRCEADTLMNLAR